MAFFVGVIGVDQTTLRTLDFCQQYLKFTILYIICKGEQLEK